MKVKVLISFHDASNFAKVYRVGDVIEVEEKRAETLKHLNLVEAFEEEKKPIEEPKEKPKRAKKQR